MNRRGSYWLNLLKGQDYSLATWFGIPAGIYISSYVLFKEWMWCVKVINWMFRDDLHCATSLKNNEQDIQYYYHGG